MVDPYAHGTPAGDHHTWVDPGRPDCPNCVCCLVRLCQTAQERGVPCTDLTILETADCPCAPNTKEG